MILMVQQRMPWIFYYYYFCQKPPPGLYEWCACRLSNIYLNCVLLKIEVSCVLRYTVWDLIQALPCTDDPAGLVGAGTEGGAWRCCPCQLRPMVGEPQQKLDQPEEGGRGKGAGHHDKTHGN